MKVEKRDGSQERKILIGLITDKAVLARIASKWDKKGLFNNKWSNIIAGWCVDYFERYDEAPSRAIEGLFESWAAKSKDKTSIRLIEKFLNSLSTEYETSKKESNSSYLIDLAGIYFNKVRLKQLTEILQGDIDSGKVDEALKRIDSFSQVQMGVGTYIDVLRDQTAIREAFESKSEPLISYPGALGEFFGESLERDGFIALMGPEKRGKSWMLQDIAWRAMQQRCKVAFFEVGDLSEHQILRRFMVRAAKHPFRLNKQPPLRMKGGFPNKVRYPISIEVDQETRLAKVEYDIKKFKEALDWKIAYQACERTIKKTRTKETLLRLSVHPNSSISVAGVRTILRGWEREGWVPDVVVIDYADILAPPSGVADTRDQINATWKQLRALSQSLHCLVVTATQADAGSYRVDTLTRTNFSEDKRKFAHTTGLFGINQTNEEKLISVQRFNWLVLREEGFVETACVHVAGALELASPCIKSSF